MRIDRVPLHTRSLGDSADAGPRRPQLGVQIDGRFDDAAAGLRLIFCSSFKRVAASSNHCTLLYPYIDNGQSFHYT